MVQGGVFLYDKYPTHEHTIKHPLYRHHLFPKWAKLLKTYCEFMEDMQQRVPLLFGQWQGATLKVNSSRGGLQICQSMDSIQSLNSTTNDKSRNLFSEVCRLLERSINGDTLSNEEESRFPDFVSKVSQINIY